MAMDGDLLGQEILSKVQEVIDEIAQNQPGTPMTNDQKNRLHSVAGAAIVDHIRNNAQITTPAGPGSIT